MAKSHRSNARYPQSTANQRLRSDATQRQHHLNQIIQILGLGVSAPTLYEDRRRHHPDGYHRPALTVGQHTKLQLVRQPASARHLAQQKYPDPRLRFKAPERVLICVRRHQRKEVMFATNKAGRGGQRRPTRNNYTNIHC